MKITIDKRLSNAKGVFKPGDEVDWKDVDAQPLLDYGMAHPGWDSERPKPKPKKRPAKKPVDEPEEGAD